MKQLLTAAHSWANSQFGQHRHPSHAIAHLAREVIELSEKPFDLEEYADVLLLVFDAAANAGFSYDTLRIAVAAKLNVNQGRKWGKPDAEGVCEHVKTKP